MRAAASQRDGPHAKERRERGGGGARAGEEAESRGGVRTQKGGRGGKERGREAEAEGETERDQERPRGRGGYSALPTKSTHARRARPPLR